MKQKRLETKINIQYAVLFTFYIGSNAAILGFSVLLLQSRGFPSELIGVSIAVASALSVFIPSALVEFYLRQKKRVQLNHLLALISGIITMLTVIMILPSLPQIFLILLYVVTASLAISLYSLLNAFGMQFADNGIHINYGLARACGSISYGIVALIIGALAGKFGAGSIMIVYGVMMLFLAAALLFHEKVPAGKSNYLPAESRQENSLISLFSGNVELLCFFVAAIAISFNLCVLDTYQKNIIQKISGTAEDYGIVLFIMGICELPVQFFYSKLIKRIKIYILMTVAFSGFIIKDVLLIFVQTVFGVFILQLINIIAVGCYLPSLVYFTNEIIERRPEQNVQAHAMISGTATNLGRVLGSFAGGTLIGLGGVKPMLTTSALVSAAGLIMMLLSQKCRKREEIGI